MHWLLALAPLFALTFNVIVQTLFAHSTHLINRSIMFGLMAGLVINIAILASLSQQGVTLSWADYIVSILTYLSLAFCFFAFLNLNLTSLRIRIMRELRFAEGTGMTSAELAQLYSPSEMYLRRIERLVQTQQIVNRDNKWFIQSRKLLPLVVVSKALRKLIMGSNYDVEQNK